MSVYKRGSKWTYHVGVTVNGRREQHKRGGFATKEEAQRAERLKLSEVDGGMRHAAITCRAGLLAIHAAVRLNAAQWSPPATKCACILYHASVTCR